MCKNPHPVLHGSRTVLENDFKELQLQQAVAAILIACHNTVWLCEEGQKTWFMGSSKGECRVPQVFFDIFTGVYFRS